MTVDVALTIAACPLRTQIERDVGGHVAVPGLGARRSRSRWPRWTPRSGPPSWPGPVGRRGRTPPRRPCRAHARVLAIASGKGGVGKSSVTVNLAVAPGPPRLHGRDPRRRHLGLLRPPAPGHGGGRRGPARGRWCRSSRPSGPALVRVLSMGFLADEEQAIMWRGPRAQPRRAAVPPGRPLGRPRLPADRPAPGHRRHPDGAGPPAAPHRAARRDDAAGGGAEGGGPGGRHGPAGLPPRGRRDREHERLHLRARHDLRAVRLGRRRAAGPGPRACRSSAPSRCTPTWPPRATPACRWPPAEGELADGLRRDGPRDRRGRGAARRGRGLHGPPARAGGGGGRPTGRPRRAEPVRRVAGRPALRRRPSDSRWCPRPRVASRTVALPSSASARRWAHSEKRATGSWRSVTSP